MIRRTRLDRALGPALTSGPRICREYWLTTSLDTAAAKALAKHLEKGATGRLYVTTGVANGGSGQAEVSVYVQTGALMAAEGSDDGFHYLRRLRVAEAIAGPRVIQFLGHVAKGTSIFGDLVDIVPPEILDPILLDRFRDNLARFVGSTSKAKFEFTAGVFVDNLRFGVDAGDEIALCAAMYDNAAGLELDVEILRGANPPQAPIEKLVYDSLAGPKAISSLLARMPLEPIAGRALLAELLDRGVVAIPGDEPPATLLPVAPASSVPPARPRAVVVSDDLDDESNDLADEATAEEPRIAPRAARLTSAGDAPPEDVADLPSAAVTALPLDDEPPPEDVGDAPSEGISDAPSEDISDAPSEDINDAPSEASPGAGNLSSLNAWMSHGVEADEDLEAFADFDEVRGSADDKGSFSTETHNLDRVEVSPDLVPSAPKDDPDAPIEVDEIPQAKFGAPTLTEEEAVEKVAVANEVLSHVIEVFDEHQGKGAGIAALQLLLEGAPAKFAPLFEGMEIGEDEVVDADGVVSNLAGRPPTEHRRVLNDGLVDLIERALSIGADELPDAAIDEMLEKTAGYRGRMGL